MKDRWRISVALVVIMACLGGQLEIALHQFEHAHLAERLSGPCTLCALAYQTVMPAVASLPIVVVDSLGEKITVLSPIPAPCSYHLPFGPRSPPVVASL